MLRRGQIVDAMLSPSLAQFKAHLRITSQDMDTDLAGKLRAAVYAAEHCIGQIIAVSEYTYTGAFSNVIALTVPIVAVTEVKVDGEAIDASLYNFEGCIIRIGDGVEGHQVEVALKAGMSAVPDDIQAAILLHASSLFSNPVDSVEQLPKASTNLLRPYRIWR